MCVMLWQELLSKFGKLWSNIAADLDTRDIVRNGGELIKVFKTCF